MHLRNRYQVGEKEEGRASHNDQIPSAAETPIRVIVTPRG
jgi:hypothetical protein